MLRHRPGALLAIALLLGCDSGQSTPLVDPVFPGLTADVEVLVDDHGIPHLYGATDADVLFAAGYQMATDRLFQMDLIRRRALGRLAEVMPEKRRDDENARLFGFARWGREDAARLLREAPDEYALFVAWTAGVNRRIEEVRTGRAPLPYGFGPGELDYAPEPWANTDGFAVAKMLVFGNSNTLERDVLATVVATDYPEVDSSIELVRPLFDSFTVPPEDRPAPRAAPLPARTPTVPSPAIASPGLREALATLHEALAPYSWTGSNNWAVSGRFTANGRPLIANDPHQPLQSPTIMYAQHLDSLSRGGTLDVVGFGFVGTPLVQLGHNRRIHWAATTNFADVMDLWDVTPTADGRGVNVGGTTAPIVDREELIRIRGAGMPAGVGIEHRYVVQEVPGYGIILPRTLAPLPIGRPGRILLLNWTGFRATSEARCFLALDRAQSLDDFERAAGYQEVGAFNFVGADATGIAYRVHALVPDRGDPATMSPAWQVRNGDDPSSFWRTFLPDEKLPHSRAPMRGWVATANNDPWGFTANGRLDDDPWYYGAFYAPGERASRIESELARLAARGSVTPEEMQILQTDAHSPVADVLVPMLSAARDRVATDTALAEFRGRDELVALVDRLVAWDRQMRRSSADALLFHATMHFVTARVLADDLDFLFDLALEASPVYTIKIAVLALAGAFPRGDGVLQGGRDWLLLSGLSDAAAWLEGRFGGLEATRYAWGDMHGTRFDNSFGGMLDGGWTATDGGQDTVNVSVSAFFDSGGVRMRFDSHDGGIFRVVTSFADDGTPEARMNFPRGNSGDPASPHFADTLEDWVEGRYDAVPYRRAEVEAVVERRATVAR